MTPDARRLYLVLYDIVATRRRRKVFNALQAAGAWTQYSAFFCRLSPTALGQLKALLRTTIEPAEDRLLIVDLGDAERAHLRVQLVGDCATPPAAAAFLVL